MQKKTLSYLLIIMVTIFIHGCGQNQKKAPPLEKEEIKTSTASDIAMPKSVNELKGYLSNFIPKELAKDNVSISIEKSTNIQNAYLVDIDIQTKKISKDKALLYARDFIFATYKAVYSSELPVIYVSSMTYDENNERILAVGIGKKIADRLPKETWSELKMSPSDFEKWAQKNYSQNIINGKTFFDGRCFYK